MRQVEQPGGCQTRFPKELDRFLAGSLSRRRESRLQRHLQTCPLCRQQLREMQTLQKWLGETPRPAPTRDFRLSPKDVPARPTALWYPRLRTATAVVGILVTVLFAAELLIGTGRPTEGPGQRHVAVRPTPKVTVPPPSVMVAPAITRRLPPITVTEGDIAAPVPTAAPEPSPSAETGFPVPAEPSPWIQATVSRPTQPAQTEQTEKATVPWWPIRFGGLSLLFVLGGLTWVSYRKERRFLPP
jgi:hypothetical protein